MATSRLIYSSYYPDMGLDEDDIRKSYEDAYGEEMTDNQLWDYIQLDMEEYYGTFEDEMKRFMNGKRFLIDGTLGLWDGMRHVGDIIEDFDDLMKHLCLRGDYELKFEDVAGKLIITQSHHDGTNMFELRELTKKGMRKVDANPYDNILRELEEVKCYTKNANYAKEMWA